MANTHAQARTSITATAVDHLLLMHTIQRAIGNSQSPYVRSSYAVADEAGVGSGVRRDWLNNMTTAMLDPQTGLFESDDGGQTVQPCPLAHLQEHHLVYFEMLGQLSSKLRTAPCLSAFWCCAVQLGT